MRITAPSVRKRHSCLPGRATCLVISAAILPVLGLPRLAHAQGHGPSTVEVVAVEERAVAPTIELVGTVRPQLRTVIASEVAGLVAEMPADEGDSVVKGQILCKLRDAPIRYRLDEAQARVAEYEAILAEQQAELRKAEFNERRTTGLWELKQCAEKEYVEALADLDAAKGRIEQAMHSMAAQKAVAATLADDLERSQIRSPCDGYVVAKQTEIGAWVDKGGAVFDFLDLSTVRVRVSVPERNIPYAVVGELVVVKIDATGQTCSGTISRVIPDGDERARTFPVEIDIKNPDGELKAGMFVRASVPAGPKAKMLVVPKDAIVVRGPMSMVYVIQKSESGQMAMPMPVKLGTEVADWVAVSSQGLTGGMQVVVRGNEFLQGPSPVIAVPVGATPADAAPPKSNEVPASQPS